METKRARIAATEDGAPRVARARVDPPLDARARDARASDDRDVSSRRRVVARERPTRNPSSAAFISFHFVRSRVPSFVF
jgi:hypothetical protein